MGESARVTDVVGVGFGPANLALAVALQELGVNPPGGEGLTVEFLEAQPRFGWHSGMLIDDATMQVSFLKDLVTPRNPTSPYSFVAYLHKVGRLSRFIDSKSLHPLRIEFHGYLEWVAGHFADRVEYGSRVTAIRPVRGAGGVELLDVVAETADGAEVVRRTRSVVLACGLRPNMPEGLVQSDRIWHTSALVPQVRRIADTAPKSFVVLGAGQSSAEAAHYLHRKFTRSSVSVVHSRYGYSASDDSPFVNAIFGAEAVDEFFSASPEVKRMMLDYHANTNYSVVDQDLIQRLHGDAYRESLLGDDRLSFHHVSRVRDVTPGDHGVRVEVESLSDGHRTVIMADVLVCATGYRPADPADLLGDLLPLCEHDDRGRLLLDRDRRLVTCEPFAHGVYAQGYGEHTHGIAETLLSLTAQRAGELAEALAKELVT
ncbi:lysine N(6)-hydroxylase/L-ornithine N(5)-oxygenase family protein [Saccharothrix isguenensis]